MLSEQKSAASFGEPISVPDAPAIHRAFYKRVLAKAQKIGMKLAAATKWQHPGNLARIMPAPIAERFEHQAFQFAALSHRGNFTSLCQHEVLCEGKTQGSPAKRGNSKS